MTADTEATLKVTPPKIASVLRRLIATGRPRKIILFGSCARGTQREDSDLDILVVTDDEITPPHRQSALLRRTVDDILMAMDIVVVPEKLFELLRHTPGLIYREACETGQLVYERPD